MKDRILVTSGLPYSNGLLHVGHIAGAYLPADIYVRYQKLNGKDVRFVCGSDDHGVPVMLSAQKEGKEPGEIVDYYNQKQAEAFKGLNIEFDVYGSTCRNKYHYKTSQDLFLSLYEKGYFEKISSEQFYDEKQDMFLPDRYVKGTCGYCGAEDQNSDQCEECGKVLDTENLKNPVSVISKEPATVKETSHWYLDFSKFEDTVVSWVESAKIREQTKSFLRGLISTGLVKRAMTRDLSWGIPVPLGDPDAKNKVLYVWFDAPIGYISNTQQLCEELDGDAEKYTDWWKSADCDIIHFIGEDNTIFHCLMWIAMLHGEGTYKLPTGVIVNQFLNIQFPGQDEAEKISKSRGQAVWIEDYLAAGDNVDSLRYYLTSIAPEKARTVYKPEDLIAKNNADLANTLGNFVNRILSFTKKHVGDHVPDYPEDKITDIDKDFMQKRQAAFEAVSTALENFEFKNAQEKLFEFIRECNRYVDTKEPWKTRKDDLEATKLTLNYCIQAIKSIGLMLRPFLPDTANKICTMLNVENDTTWADTCNSLEQGHAIGKAVILFEKIE